MSVMTESQQEGRATAPAGYFLDAVPFMECLNCGHPIGDGPYREVRILARFGQMMFEHEKCPETKEAVCM